MKPLFISLLLAALCPEGRAQQDMVQQPGGDVTATGGEAATLGCRYVSSSTSVSLLWYKQEGISNPTFILIRFQLGEGNTADDFRERFSSTLNSTSRSSPLKIKKLQPSDSAVYYCALQPVGGNKIVFGNGTRLTIEPRDDYEPSYYELGDVNGTSRACLATGFSRSNATLENQLFKNSNSSRAVRASGDSLHSEVLLLSEQHRGQCEIGTVSDENESGVCVETLDKDVTVNTVSLLVVALRLLFIKTVVFNVLMTLRLWLRH